MGWCFSKLRLERAQICTTLDKSGLVPLVLGSDSLDLDPRSIRVELAYLPYKVGSILQTPCDSDGGAAGGTWPIVTTIFPLGICSLALGSSTRRFLVSVSFATTDLLLYSQLVQQSLPPSRISCERLH